MRCLFGLWLALLAGNAVAQQTVRYCDYPVYPPISWSDGKQVRGLAPSVVKQLFAELGYQVEMVVLGNWKRCLLDAAEGRVDVVLAYTGANGETIRASVVRTARRLFSGFVYAPASQRLAELMRRMRLCEEKGSGIDKVVHLAEVYQLPAPDFRTSETRTIAILFAHQDFAEMSKSDRIRACYQHCALKYVSNERMSNQSLRERFKLPESKAATASQVIGATKDAGLVKADESDTTSTRYARYLPFWASNLLERMWLVIGGLIVLLLPLSRVVPPLYTYRVRRRVFRWYARLREVEAIMDDPEADPQALLDELDELDRVASQITVPLAHADELYALRNNIEKTRRRLLSKAHA